MNDRIFKSDQIPNNPLEMPPPYWRSSGAIFHILDALHSLPELLSELISVHGYTELRLGEYYEQHPDEASNDDELEEFGEICNDLWELEHRIKLKAELVILMSAIQAEDEINRFCVFNLHKDIAESIESLSPAEKLLIASASFGKANTKGSAVYEAIKKLSAWRNAFAHGHCVDRPTKSLRHNHLIAPPQYPGVPDSLAKMQELTLCYRRIDEYLSAISLNEYTKGRSTEIEELSEYLDEISAYKFSVSPNSNDIYEIEYNKT
ncbi:MAG TPA: hypothetical protein VK206_01870 [Anaerolineales bacterium]|nr:hypothetical protein [Anaerolineales bacterium]